MALMFLSILWKHSSGLKDGWAVEKKRTQSIIPELLTVEPMGCREEQNTVNNTRTPYCRTYRL